MSDLKALQFLSVYPFIKKHFFLLISIYPNNNKAEKQQIRHNSKAGSVTIATIFFSSRLFYN